ncbi:PhoX domain-containing protein [Cylindrobasidium torrendii FP15055 ss-10]|uniref:PhoX domain-containing protein n=1 Tax=Cylindrobasidium torrendii FP15055 ss-10 TaxID=1314674 RepID=A0A0D7BSS0_9AGAR|nr:PhoX domain-containing protein [Cylindrobasidium torrendii FP15055 ss-10]
MKSMTQYASMQGVLVAGAVVVLVPVLLRMFVSPVFLVLLFPLFLVLLAIAFLALYLFFGHFLDSNNRMSSPKLAYAARPFSFSTPAAWQVVQTRSQWSENTPPTFDPLFPDSPEVSEAMEDIIEKILRDFVMVWYASISTSSSFPFAVNKVIHGSLERLLDRTSGIDLPAIIVKRILPKVTEHIELFRQSEVALRGAALERRLTHSEELDILLASRYAAGIQSSKLHEAVDNLSTTFTKQTEEKHLRQIIDRALPHILPAIEGQSKAIRLVVREIASCSVLYPVMDMLSDPDFWNRMIDQIAGAAIHQQKLITKVRNVLEAQQPSKSQHRMSTAIPSSGPSNDLITIRTDVRQFESFLRSISRFSSLLDARRLKNDVFREIRRTRLLLANHENEDWIDGEKTEDVVAYLDRLYTAKRKVDERISILGGGAEDTQSTNSYPDSSSKKISLRDILGNPSSLSYFMEFMDRRQRSLLVQFWLTVESFKNPLEAVESDDEDEHQMPQDPSDAVTAKEDISMMNDLYFSSATAHPSLAFISQKHVDAIRDFARSEVTPSQAVQNRVRRNVMQAQKQVEKEMEQHFEDFERSDLWFRAIGDTDFGQKKTVESTPERPVSIARPVPKKGSPSQPVLNRTDSAPAAVGMSRTSSAGSLPSVKSGHSRVLRPSNLEVLMGESPTESNRAPLFDDPDDKEQRAHEQRMEAIHAALTDIMSMEEDDSRPPSSQKKKRAPSSTKSQRRALFEDDDPEEYVADESGERIEEAQEDEDQHAFQLAAPGDLQLSYEINRLGDKITSLQSQETMLDNLIKKAELTGDTQELKLLETSKSAMNRELRELQFQKMQYQQQESANRLFSDRTKVTIVNSTTGDEGGKAVVRYLVEVQQLAADGTFSSGWVVARRYNEFFTMYNKLRDKYAPVRNLEFPGKRLVPGLSLNGAFLDARKVGLEKFLQACVAIPAVCESDELKAFLSRESPFVAAEPKSPASSTPPKGSQVFSGTDLVRNVYRSVAESIDDMIFGPSMLDVMIQRLTRQAAEFAGLAGTDVTNEELVAQALRAAGRGDQSIPLSADLKPLEGESSTSSFTEPICDLLLAVFELNKQNNVNWLRRQAIVIILQQVLGGTIERKIRETAKMLVDAPRLLGFLDVFRNGMWPDGKLKPPSPPRTAEDKMKTRDEANRKLSALFPDLAANMIGRSNARRGARRIFAVLQNRRLNQHILYIIVDEMVNAMFPEGMIHEA